MNLHVDPHSLVPPSQQLVVGILDAIARGELRPGDRLPAVRTLAADVLVNPNTVTKAWRDLERMGATEGRNGSGVFVTPTGPTIARKTRLAETLTALRAAAAAALAAGHDAQTLKETLAQALRGESVGGRR